MPNNMTIKEAIIELNRCKVSGYMPTDWHRRCLAIELAKAALERQEAESEMKLKAENYNSCDMILRQTGGQDE